MAEYRIDELARQAGTTVRNVRAYQDRGLIPPPRRAGRVGLYDDAHLARLKLIGQLLERGFTLGNIAELLSAWERGQDLRELLGLEIALAAPWSDEVPIYMTLEELAELYGEASTAEALQGAVELGVLEPDGDRFKVLSPRELRAGAELAAAGIPLDAVFAHGRLLRRDLDRIAARFVGLVTAHVFDPLGDELPAEEIPRLADLVQRLRPVAEIVVDAELARAMERHVQKQLAHRLPRVVARALTDDAAASDAQAG